jgi:N6-L-threonylcarbamoyladenine synthase
MSILALETSCDDTCAAVIDDDGRIRANVISSQTAHEDFGGVVPEIASRHHLELVNAIVQRALDVACIGLDDVRLVGATQGPGLVGALLVGLSTAKALAAARELPFAAVDHLQGHVAANFLTPAFEPPFLCLIASGGHTLLAHVREHDGFQVLGRTLDDAAGEAFDKGARMLGLGYPAAFVFPGSRGERSHGGRGAQRQAFAQGLDFSFAGLKTALLYKLRELSEDQARARRADLAASYQAAIVDSLIERAERGLAQTGLDRLAVGGGVAANGPLRERLAAIGVALHVPERVLCTDNAAMIASAARYGQQLAYPQYLGLDAYATGERAR